MAVFSKRQEQIQPDTRRPRVVSAIRNAVLFGAVAAPMLLNAQIKQISFPKDSSEFNMGKRWYATFKQDRGQSPAAITFVGNFSEVYIPNHPRKELKVNDDIILNIDVQKALQKYPTIAETANYVFIYAPEIDGVSIHRLLVWRKNSPTPTQSAPNPSDTLK
ncbi:MAG: hypothetical protein WC263_02725 [Candidatus Micrarchaeia archaeon]